MAYTLGELATRVSARVDGDADTLIQGVGTLPLAGPGQISFLTNSRYRKHLANTQAGAVILRQADRDAFSGNALISDNPHATYARVASLFAAAPFHEAGVHPSAVIHPSARLADSVCVGANAVIGPGVTLGDGVIVGPGCVLEGELSVGAESRLVAQVSLYHGTTIGRRAIIHAGAVIGSDGFGFAHDQGQWLKVPQLGGVRIGDDVEIGASTTVDRGAIEDTVIGNGVKLDNLVQVAHNVRIGDHTVIAGCVGIAGSTTIGSRCAIAGGVGILGHLEIVDGVTVTAMSLVTKSIKAPGVYSAGTPLEPTDRWQKNFARFKQLDEMARRMLKLEKELEELKKG